MKNDSKSNLIALFITIISIIILIISVVFSSEHRLSKDEINNIQSTAQNLVNANFDTASYFGIASLNVADAYNPNDYPSDCVPCSADIFKSYDELSAFVNGTYIPDTAAIILNSQINGNNRYFDYNGQLCMTVAEHNIDYKYDWSVYKIKLSNIKSNSADIIVTMNLKSSDSKVNDGSEKLEFSMVKQNNKWLLENFDY